MKSKEEKKEARDKGYQEYLKRNSSDSTYSWNPQKQRNIDYDAWTEFISYYRYYIDEFATDILGIKLFPFQRVILRAMARYQNSVLIACRGIGKSWIIAVYFICTAILYKNIKLGIASGNSQQARNVIIQKIKGELSKNPNVAREITDIRVQQSDCYVEFKNGSEIRAITLAQDRGGDSARSWRFQMLLVDEARLVKDNIIEEILIPMTKTPRQIALDYGKHEEGKIIFISSAYLKTSGLYKRFKFHFEEMERGNKDYCAICFPYMVGVQAGLFSKENIEKELDKPSMTKEKFSYEYEGVFVGSDGESYYPYELTMPCRVLQKPETSQPKKSTSVYLITHDVAVSGERNSDNACTHVLKLRLRPNGTYEKQLVYTKVMKGASLNEQRDFLRELVHLKFPNTKKLVIDARGTGTGLPSMLYDTWDYTDPKAHETTEYPPLVADDDEDGMMLEGAIPLIRKISATNEFNTTYYPYMKSCFEDGSLKLLKSSEEVDDLYKSGEMTAEEYAQFIEHDILQSELSNIKQVASDSNNIIYERILKTKKRDRATSLFYGLSVVCEWEIENKLVLHRSHQSGLDKLYQYTFM